MRAGDIPGWHDAVSEALEKWPNLPFAAAAEVRLPLAPRHATVSFVRDLARIFDDHVRASHTRIAVRQ